MNHFMFIDFGEEALTCVMSVEFFDKSILGWGYKEGGYRSAMSLLAPERISDIQWCKNGKQNF